LRADQYIAEKFPEFSRNQIQTLIKNGEILLNGKTLKKSSFKIEDEPEIEFLKKQIYVGRGGDKLALFFDEVEIDISEKTVLDVGASTGGFTEVLLEKGASKVFALDVGTLQLHEKLRNDSRVISIENMDIRNFQTTEKFELITVDVSFISLHSIISDLYRLGNKYLLLLFKPQFEVGKNVKRDSRGVVLDQKAIEKSETEFIEKCEKEFSLKLISKQESKVSGKEGNKEFFLFFQKTINL
jgi:23S rRNA (cytidine1920-2'-O)/16S rRNA (cytidine1409-2'-O)-methyltransferase